MALIREYSTQIALPGASKTTLAPCLLRSYLGGYQRFDWRSLEKQNGTVLQNKHKNLGTKVKQSARSSHWKSMKLPVLEHSGASHGPKGGENWKGPLSTMRLQNHLRKKYTYLHFSSPARLEVKPPPRQARCGLPLRRHQHLQLRSVADPTVQDLMISGVTVPLTRAHQDRRPKMEIHVYVPSGKKGADAESLDEGFLEETEKLSMLSLEDSIL